MDATSGSVLLSPDPVKKFLAAGVPREETRPKDAGGRSSRNSGGARAATIGFPIAPAHLLLRPSTRDPTVERRI